jgi:glycosyltransferase involved in cell wall biosynthesis
MEIIHIILGKANPERMNGVNRVVYQLATQQSHSGRIVSVWGITKVMSHDYGDRNFETCLFQAKTNIFQIDEKLKREIIKAKSRNVVFHLHGGWIPTFYSITNLMTEHKISYVFTPHGAYNTIAMKKSKWIKKIYFQLFEKHLLKNASAVHCIGKSEVQGLNTLMKSSKVFLMPYGFEINSVVNQVNKSTNKKFIIGFIGRLDIYTKGLDLLLDAFKLFNERDKKACLWIIGDSDQRSKLNQMVISRGIEKDVVLWGSKFGKDKHNLLNQMDVFAHPSRNEGLPSSVLEAASFGIPCLVTNATNVGDQIVKNKCGFSVRNENVDAIKNALFAMDDLRRSGSLKKLGDRAKLMVKKEFGWKHIVNEFDNLYSIK